MPGTGGHGIAPELGAGTGGALDRPLSVTFFPDATASTKREEKYTLRSLASRINAITAARKARLPWLKLAKFGDLRSDKGCLRHDGNVTAISGIEADYDGGVMLVDEACDLLSTQGIASLVYTSPSHTEDAPRWRILCPLSEEMPPDRRSAHMGRLNGLFRGIFAGESWTLSQSYYFGSVNRNPSHRVEVIDGSPIDAHDDLDTIWLGRPGGSVDGDRTSSQEAREDAELIRCVVTGEHLHGELCALAARYIGRGIPDATVEELMRGMMLSHPECARNERWLDRLRSIPELVASARRKYRADDAQPSDPRRKEVGRVAFRLLRRRLPAAQLVGELHRLNQQYLEPLPSEVVNSIALWATRQHVASRHA
jgi:hypothetical protein